MAVRTELVPIGNAALDQALPRYLTLLCQIFATRLLSEVRGGIPNSAGRALVVSCLLELESAACRPDSGRNEHQAVDSSHPVDT